jgi:hypothetical protein
MNRANQQALIHQTNLGVLAIRQSELRYYVDLNGAFGTQAALVGGFTYGVFTQHAKIEGYYYADTFENIYWVAAAATIACAIHVIITTMALQVLGPGLALNGPVGSMTKATEGLKAEQRYVTTAFIMMMVLFAVSTILTFWFVFTLYSSIVATLVFVVAGRFWYVYCERIYLRFYWDDSDVGHFRDTDAGQRPSSDNPLANVSPIHKVVTSTEPTPAGGVNVANSNNNQAERRNSKDKLAKKVSLWRSILGEKKRAASGEKPPASTSSVTGDNVIMEGYMQKKGAFANEGKAAAEAWERRYIVLNRSGQFFVFKSRLDYRNYPKQPLHGGRGVILSDFKVEVTNNPGTPGVTASLYQVTLNPRDRDGENVWQLKVDNEGELERWVLTMRDISPTSFIY